MSSDKCQRQRRVHLNGIELVLGPDDELPTFKPEVTADGTLSLAPIPNAANPPCR